jgi:hypothetical protein
MTNRDKLKELYELFKTSSIDLHNASNQFGSDPNDPMFIEIFNKALADYCHANKLYSFL